MKRILTVFLVAGALAVAAPLSAQDRTGTWEITPFGGGYFGGTLHAGSNALFDQDVSLGTAPTYGVRLGYNFNRVVGVEFNWSQAKPDIHGPSGDLLFGPTVKLGEMTNNVFELNALFNLARGRVIPYFSGGFGAMTFAATVPGETTSTDVRFVGNIGGGVKFFVTPKVAIRVDGRYRSSYISDNAYYGHGCRDCYYYWDGNWYGSGEVTGGLTYAFGR